MQLCCFKKQVIFPVLKGEEVPSSPFVFTLLKNGFTDTWEDGALQKFYGNEEGPYRLIFLIGLIGQPAKANVNHMAKDF
jgi:hypothetical protein